MFVINKKTKINKIYINNSIPYYMLTINSSNIKVRNSKAVDKNCDSCDYYFGPTFLFNEVDCYSKSRPAQVVSYQYFTQLSLTKSISEQLAAQFGGYSAAKDTKSSSYYIYFSNSEKAFDFINSREFQQLVFNLE